MQPPSFPRQRVTVSETPIRSMVKIPNISPRAEPASPKFDEAVVALARSPVGTARRDELPPAWTKA